MERALMAHQWIRYEEVLRRLFNWAVSGSYEAGPVGIVHQAMEEMDRSFKRTLVCECSDVEQEEGAHAVLLLGYLLFEVEYRVQNMRIRHPAEMLERIDAAYVVACWWLGVERAEELREQGVDIALPGLN